MSFTLLLFCVCCFILFYTYIGYGLLVGILVCFKRLRAKKKREKTLVDFPAVTLFITAYNEEACIDKKMQNSLRINYPANKLEILWVTDGTTDDSLKKLQAYPQVKVLHEPERRGKTAAINRGMPHVSSQIVVFTDANTMLNRDAILFIATAFLNPKVGCVSGEKRVEAKKKDSASAGGENAYWKYESFLKELDAQLYTAVGAAGELFAIRRELFRPLPEDTLLDDFMLSMKIAQKGYKIAYSKEAYAIEQASKDIREEGKRKVRIAAGGLQAVSRLLPLLNIFRYGWLSFQYISHRVLRWTVTPVVLFLLLPLNVYLLLTEPSLPILILLVLQLITYLAAGVGWYLSHKNIRHKFFFIPYYFFFMHINVWKGFFYLKKNGGNAIWEKAQRL